MLKAMKVFRIAGLICTFCAGTYFLFMIATGAPTGSNFAAWAINWLVAAYMVFGLIEIRGMER